MKGGFVCLFFLDILSVIYFSCLNVISKSFSAMYLRIRSSSAVHPFSSVRMDSDRCSTACLIKSFAVSILISGFRMDSPTGMSVLSDDLLFSYMYGFYYLITHKANMINHCIIIFLDDYKAIDSSFL